MGTRAPDGHSLDPTGRVPSPTIVESLARWAEHTPDAPAVLASGRSPLTYARMYAHVDEIGHVLRAMGVDREDRVAVVLPNGPEMAVAILSAAAWAACAPLNPAYGVDELDRYLTDLRPRALITQAGLDSPARRVAMARGVAVIELSAIVDAAAGLFTLSGGAVGVARSDRTAVPDDVALLLLTSGTTSRPKIVPLTHANVCASASFSRAALALTPRDRCLNVLPLFHGHGLIATVLASLDAGGSIVCTRGPDTASFVAWVDEFQPTWYSAVPTIHQAVLAQAGQSGARMTAGQLRFIRSGSAPLPHRVLEDLERTFAVPVIQFYGMTEVAAAPIACNPLPPGQRKPRSAGVPVGLDVAIVDEGGAFLPGGRSGEIVVRGPSVMHGYDGGSTAATDTFWNGWFRTGDQGFFDDEGYLFLTGRSKEIINRGGEKIAPQEVDQALMDHPAVARAVTFAVPHARLGEDVAAAVVLWPHAAATAKELRQWVMRRVADFKVPRNLLIVPELPAGPTGKVVRIGLPERLGLAAPGARRDAFAIPRTPVEELLVGLWAQLLDVDEVGIHDDFFTLGGDSLLATQLLARIYDVLRAEVAFSSFFEAPTVAELARHVETVTAAGPERAAATIPLLPRGEPLPMSVAQERLWELEGALPGLPFFTVLYAAWLRGPLDVAVLEQSLNEIVRRHEILRTTVTVAHGRAVQVIAPALHVSVDVDDLGIVPESDKTALAQARVRDEALRPFSLVQGPLLRARVLRWGERESLLIITTHQAVADGWSLGVLTEELATLYDAFSSGQPSPLPPLSMQYADFADWQRRWASLEPMVAQLAYWKEQLRGPLPVLQLPTDRPRRPRPTLSTARRALVLSAELSAAVTDFSRREGATPFMVLVSALKVLLRGYLGQDDLRVASLIANRNRPGTSQLIGPLANTVILRTSLSGDPSRREVLRRVRATTLAAYANQDVPLEDVVQTLEREPGFNARGLSPVMLVLQNATLRYRIPSGRALAFEEANPSMVVPLVAATTFDVVLVLNETTQGLQGGCLYKADLFDATTVDRMLDDFRYVLERFVSGPERPVSAIGLTATGGGSI